MSNIALPCLQRLGSVGISPESSRNLHLCLFRMLEENLRRGTISTMLGVPVRLHDMTGGDLGVAHVPWPVQVGDLVALEHAEFRVNRVVETGQMLPIAALVEVRPALLSAFVG